MELFWRHSKITIVQEFQGANMKRQIILVVNVVLLAIAQCAWASQQPSDANNPQTLQDYLRYASLNNAELKAKFHQWKAAVEQVPQAKPSMMNPQDQQTPPAHQDHDH